MGGAGNRAPLIGAYCAEWRATALDAGCTLQYLSVCTALAQACCASAPSTLALEWPHWLMHSLSWTMRCYDQKLHAKVLWCCAQQPCESRKKLQQLHRPFRLCHTVCAMTTFVIAASVLLIMS